MPCRRTLVLGSGLESLTWRSRPGDRGPRPGSAEPRCEPSNNAVHVNRHPGALGDRWGTMV